MLGYLLYSTLSYLLSCGAVLNSGGAILISVPSRFILISVSLSSLLNPSEKISLLELSPKEPDYIGSYTKVGVFLILG